MSEENKNTEQKPDALAALDSKVTSELSTLKQGINQIGEFLKASQQQKQTPAKKAEVERPDPIIDPKGYEEYLRKEITQELDQKVESRLSAQQNRNAQLANLVASYPELQDQNSELTRKAVEIFNSMDSTERNSSNAYKSAVAIAAGELGVVPVSKRRNNGDEEVNYSVNSSGNSSTRRNSSSRQKEDELDPATIAFAQAIGQNTNDPEYMKRLKTAAKRTKWNKFE